MSVLSVLRQSRPFLLSSLQGRSTILTNLSPAKRTMGHVREFEIEGTMWTFKKTWDIMCFYTYFAAFLYGGALLLSNVFVGPAQLAEIPEGYRPKRWEYYRHPVTRFISWWFQNEMQQEYEKHLAFMYEADHRSKITMLEKQIKKRMKREKDYKAYYYRPITAVRQREGTKARMDDANMLGDFDDSL